MSIAKKDIYDSIRRNTPYFEDFITRSVHHSNAIEGSTLSYAETYAILFNDNNMVVSAKPREIYEAINLKYALHYVLENLEEELSASLIKKVGIYINKNLNEIDGFRTNQVFIRGAEHVPPEAVYVPQLIQELLYAYRTSECNIFLRLAEFHIQFERIHPFIDGNGRTGRILLSKELMKEGFPPVIISVEQRADYMKFIAEQDVQRLAELIRKNVIAEFERMQKFGIRLADGFKERVNESGAPSRENEASRLIEEAAEEVERMFQE